VPGVLVEDVYLGLRTSPEVAEEELRYVVVYVRYSIVSDLL
jgi:hypothetical protein